MSDGFLGKALSIANTPVIVYTTPTNVGYTNVSFNCVNVSSIPTVMSIAITPAGAATYGDYIEYEITIPANGVLERTCLLTNSGENIILIADSANVAMRA